MSLRLHGFWLKAALAVALVVAADLLLFEREVGLNLGLVSLGLLAAAGLTNRAVWRTRLSVFAFCASLAFAVLQIERATLLGWLLYAISLGIMVLAPRAPAVPDAAQWAGRLTMAGLKSVIGPWFDVQKVLAARRCRRTLKLAAVAAAVALPLTGGAVFLWLFAQANPLIARGLAGLRLPELDPPQVIFCAGAAAIAWAALRPRGLRHQPTRAKARDHGLPTFGPTSVAASLMVFNAIFALQNGLDIAFLWSGAALPAGMSFAEYAHDGAYPLIATALLAGLSVLVFLRPDASHAVRALVIAWVAQNIFLVASTMLRTIDYIEAYSLTRMRIAALIWMVLVALGLILITWRLLRGKSGSWLINANAMAAGLVLSVCSVVDLGAVAAHWNVRHAREVGGGGVELDLAYFGDLSGAGVVSLAELERRPLDATLRCRVSETRRREVARLAERQSDWRSWRWRDARRLRRVAMLTGEKPVSALKASRRTCAPSAAPQPLTPEAKPRS